MGLMVQLSTPQDIFEQLSTKKATVDSVVSSLWRRNSNRIPWVNFSRGIAVGGLHLGGFQ